MTLSYSYKWFPFADALQPDTNKTLSDSLQSGIEEKQHNGNVEAAVAMNFVLILFYFSVIFIIVWTIERGNKAVTSKVKKMSYQEIPRSPVYAI